tara:strand:- start:43 stop:534 length:492 start_codon:yes stop_codon:yes gene_type:complete
MRKADATPEQWEKYKAYQNAWRAKNLERARGYDRKRNEKPERKEQLAETHKRYREENKEHLKEYRDEWHKSNDGKRTAYNLKRYGLSVADYMDMTATQQGLCAICGNECVRNKKLCVDHNHETGEVRELLCSKCNIGIGQFNDDPDLLKKAVRYLRRHSMRVT